MKKNRFLSLALILSIAFEASVFADSSYVVKKGDTLYSISRKYQITVQELRTANNLSESDVLKEGAKLTIPSADIGNAAALNSKTETKSAVSGSASYVVQKGDTLYGIARKYGIKVPELLSMNNMDSSSTLKAGQKLVVPSASVTTEKKQDNKTSQAVAQVKTAGEDKKAEKVLETNGIKWPLSNPVVKSISGKVSGVLLSGSDNEKVKVVREGTVMYTGVYRGFGEVVFVQSKTGLIYSYTGLKKVTCKKGDYVVSGDEIGNIGKGSDAQIKFMVFQNGMPVDPVKAPRG